MHMYAPNIYGKLLTQFQCELSLQSQCKIRQMYAEDNIGLESFRKKS